MNDINEFLTVATFAIALVTLINQISSHTISIDARGFSYNDDEFNPNKKFTEINFWLDNRSDSIATVKKVTYYLNGKALKYSLPDSPGASYLDKNIMLYAGSHNLVGNTIPFKARPDKLCIKFDKRVSLFRKKLSINLKKDKNINNS